MRRDRELLALTEARGAHAGSVLRLFRFEPWGITLGSSQDPARELDLGRCAADGVEWAVRPTGGRAIFHAEEWTYSWVTPIAHPQWGGNLRESYERIADVLLASLRELGLEVSRVSRAGRAAPPRRATGAAMPCFASTTRHEITRAGRKVLGSAQRRTRAALLQQGSLLLSNGHLRLTDYLAVAPAERLAAREGLERGAAHVGDTLGPDAPLERWADALAKVLPAGVRRVHGPAAFPLTV